MVDINCKTEDCMNFVTCEDENVTSVTCSLCSMIDVEIDVEVCND